ncbi:MAG: MBOAT family protein [Firmicutes bacterium]|nr:MBOAT family protein [Bacillota bacterium]
MVFSSTVFLFIFLPLVYLLNLVIPSVKVKNIMLTAASLLFYAFGEPIYILLMIFSITLNYFLGLAAGSSDRKKAKTSLVFAIVINLLMLGVFKYAGFAVESFNALTRLSVPVPQIRLPIGISFFTFQALSYVIDVYKGDAPPQKSYLCVMLYISFFPQLIAGPILKYHDVAAQIENRVITLDKTVIGVRRFICGLAKKLLIANTAGFITDTLFAADPGTLGAAAAWLGAVSYCLQIYFDFSGYSDMAIGLGHIFGFQFLENFNYPYVSQSIQEFWRRWHISLSTWFKEYLYIPLGGNRKGKLRTGLNKLIVFFCTGLWHGASLNFIVWGLFHGLFIMLESYGVIPVGKCRFRPLRHIYTLLVVCVGFVIFRAETMEQALVYLRTMFTGFSGGSVALNSFTSLLSPYNLTILGAGLVLSAPVKNLFRDNAATRAVSYAGSLVLLLICIITLSSMTYNPFIYFRF